MAPRKQLPIRKMVEMANRPTDGTPRPQKQATKPRSRAAVAAGAVWCTPVEWQVYKEDAGVAYRWKYKLQRITLGDDDTIKLVEDDDTFGEFPETYALNEYEFANRPQHTGYQGNGTDQSGDYPEGFQLEPIGAGSGGIPLYKVPVYARRIVKEDDTSVWLFAIPNGENGSCE